MPHRCRTACQQSSVASANGHAVKIRRREIAMRIYNGCNSCKIGGGENNN
jgi:hypothetical protein